MKTAIKISKNKDYTNISIPNDLLIHLTNTRGEVVIVTNSK